MSEPKIALSSQFYSNCICFWPGDQNILLVTNFIFSSFLSKKCGNVPKVGAFFASHGMKCSSSRQGMRVSQFMALEIQTKELMQI